ncbi:MAG: PAS domain S-box protein [Proteobacteria bacterium]|nr:PAS domain S-box protein [Pseudomonadota bacterium]
MKIKTKLRIIIIINIAAFTFLILFNLFLSEKEAIISEKANLISKLNLAIFETGQVRDEYFLYKEERSRDQSYLIHEEIASILKKMPEKFTAPHERTVLDNLTSFYNSSTALFNKVVKLDEGAPVDIAQKQELRERIISQMIVNAHSTYLETLTLREIIHEERQHTLARHNLYSNITFGFLGIFVVFLIAVALRSIARPLKKLHEGTEIIAKGNLDYKTDVRTSDEIGQLSLAFDAMTEQLRETIVSRDILDKEIEEHRKTGDALLAEKNFSESTLDSMPGVFYCYDDQLQFKRWNKNFERVSGYSAEELLKISPLDLFAGEGRQLIEERIKEVFAKGESSAETDFVSGVGIDISQRKQTEEALKESEQKYRSIFENAVEGIYQSTPEGALLSANPSFAHMLGYNSPEELLSSVTDVSRQVHPKPEQRERLLKELEEKGKLLGYTMQFIRKDGSLVWVSVSSQVVRDEKGNTQYYEGIVEDITMRQEAKLQLLSIKAYYENILESIVTGVWQTDRNDTIRYCNQGMGVIAGIEPAKIEGLNLWTDFPKETINAFGPLYLNAKVLLEPVRYDAVHVLTPSGRYTHQSGWFIPLIKDGEFDGMICTVDDVTEQKRSHEALLQAEAKYRSIFENAVEGIFQCDPDGRITSANPALVHTHGYDSEEELIKALSDIRTPLYVNPELRKEYLRLLRTQEVIENFEAEFYRKDGRKIWVCMNVRAARNNDGNIHHFVGTMESTTIRKEAEEELKQTLEKLRKSLIGTIQAMSLMVETRDPYTAGHQRSVSNIARNIAQEMALPNDTIDNIRMAGIIHDIGKISVPAEILSKPGKLSNIEFSLIKVHAQSGYNILKDVGLPYPIAEIVLQHHERMDGSGYPQGLKGDKILLEARILAVADVVEAIASHRPYRPAKGIDAALEEIEKNKGILYDAGVAEACLKLFREKEFSFE